MFRRRFLLTVSSLITIISTAGCGGGGGSPTNNARAVARAREIATTRLARATLAVAGLGRNVLTRSVGVRGSRRAALILAALRGGRATTVGFDADSALYYTLTINADGSGKQLLFSDEAHRVPGGSFTWDAPEWNNGQPDSYPAVIHVVFQITAGPYAGSSGTLDITLRDATGVNSIIRVALTNLKQEHCNGDFSTVAGVFA